MPLVAVAMSGGVDSSVAAALLIEQGYPVVGITLHLWREPTGDEEEDTPPSLTQAQRMAAQLSIPIQVVNAVDLFHMNVVTPYLEALKMGLTPNPCVFCNPRLKWKTLMDQAETLGAKFLATGHYARIDNAPGGQVRLRKGRDTQKDQSYFLCRLSQEQLAQTLFPLGDLTKREVREMARRLNLETAERKESQDLCFLGESTPTEFLLRHAPEAANPGPITNRQGDKLGEHQGLAFYTIGQRKGIKLASPRPYYVLRKDVAKNTLVVGYEEELGSQELHLADINWIAGTPPAGRFSAQVKIRYRSAEAPAELLVREDNSAEVSFDTPLRDITPGQIAVIYEGETILGGGMIL